MALEKIPANACHRHITIVTRKHEAAGAEIYTLAVLNFKAYKQSKALSFRPFLQLTARKYGDASAAAYDIFGGSLPDDLSHTAKLGLLPGPNLDNLNMHNMRMGQRVLVDIDDFLKSGEVYLLQWARHTIVQATSCAVYGEQHPFVDPDVESAYW
ncbi:hypothetical protein N657DRAFT_694029 [Parathielavia appendiculata]|uniref:Uncharacterized protein n=1 Tax=Parathielavia appendiculata TaxID=2587402 RepID=A0AAN6YZ37_9PEZI|nr:hypothetical protein N657DRAFT_694029 [Parathielavia appendiculata]